jgi:hypothetical protein
MSHILSDTNLRNEIVDGSSIGAHLSHRVEIKFEMADEPAEPVLVGFFRHNDFVDEPARVRMASRDPRNVNARKRLLKRLEQGHEIPNGKRMVLHEDTQLVDGPNACVDGMCHKHSTFVLDIADQCPFSIAAIGVEWCKAQGIHFFPQFSLPRMPLRQCHRSFPKQ